MNIFKRLWSFFSSEAHSAVSKLEDPVKMTEQGIRDLKEDLNKAVSAFAETKAATIRLNNDLKQKQQVASDYENKAVLLLKRAESGEIDPIKADELASESLARKEQAEKQVQVTSSQLKKQENMVAKLEQNVKSLKSQIGNWEAELVTLKSRAKVASTTKKLNKELARIDSSGTLAMLEQMKSKVEDDEALAESYGGLPQSSEDSIDEQINKAIGPRSQESLPQAPDSLAKLKAKLAASKSLEVSEKKLL